MTNHLIAMTSDNADAYSALQKYLSIDSPLMQSAGAKIIHRFELLYSIVGKRQIQYVTLVKYPDEASIKMVFESVEYKSFEDVKEQAFPEYQVSRSVSL